MPDAAPPAPPHSRDTTRASAVTVALTLIACLTGLLHPRLLSDGAMYEHLATGRWIAAHGALPSLELHTLLRRGAAMPADDWGGDLLMARVFDTWAFAGLRILLALALAATVFVIARSAMRRLAPLPTAGLTLLALLVLQRGYVAEPAVLAWPLIATWCAELWEAVDEARAPRWTALLLPVAWTAVHHAHLVPVALALAAALEALVPRDGRTVPRSDAQRWALLLAVTLVVVALPPGGRDTLDVARALRTFTVPALLPAWQSASFHEFQPLLVWVAVVLALALQGLAPLHWSRVLALLALLALALMRQQHQTILGLVSPFLLAAPIAAAWQRYARPRAARPLRASIGTAIAAGAACSALALSLQSRLPVAPAPAATPAAAVDAARAAGATGPVLNAFTFGGYLAFRGVPALVDGRLEQYTDSALLQVRDAIALKSEGALDSLLAHQPIGWTLLTAQAPAAEVLDHMPGWRRVYTDSLSVVHVRQAPAGGP